MLVDSRRRTDPSIESRPTLPPIHDLFSELSRSPRSLHESASQALARLSVSDREERTGKDVSFSDPFRRSSEDVSRYSPSLNTSSRPLPARPFSLSRPADFKGRRPLPSPPRVLPTIPPRHEKYSNQGSYDLDRLSLQERYQRRATLPEISPTNHYSEKRLSLDLYTSDHRTREPFLRTAPSLQKRISTEFSSVRGLEDDDDPTPVARRKGSLHPFGSEYSSPRPRPLALDGGKAPIFKYECSYCGKGFNRPSSVKIHINSHTGEKPFKCSMSGCGRRFSVLSNMRRHARGHTHTVVQPVASSDESSDIPTTTSASTSSFSSMRSSRRRDSITSDSSSISSASSVSSSRRSRSPSFDELETPPEKRSRR